VDLVLSPALAPLAAALLWAAVDVTARPEDTSCPSRAALAAALDGRVPPSAAAWSVRYRVEARAEPAGQNHVWLELRDDRGELRLRRELSIPDAGCEAAADAVALIVSRQFREVSWTGAVPLPDMVRAPEPPPPPPAPAERSWEAQAAVAARRELGIVPGLAVDARRHLGAAWVATAGLVLQAPASQQVGAGVEARLGSLPVHVSVRRALQRGRLGLELGPRLTAAAERGTTVGGMGGSQGRLVVAAGGVGAVRWTLAPAWTLALEAAVEGTILGRDFTVEGVSGAVLTPHRVQSTALLGLAWAFGP
jgi:hypothetical protein